MDKGTLDAMLSDSNEGIQNCIQIVSEASRLLTVGGTCMLTTSTCYFANTKETKSK